MLVVCGHEFDAAQAFEGVQESARLKMKDEKVAKCVWEFGPD